MLINMVLPGAVGEEPFAFTYSGDFTDSRVDGIGDVTLNTSGQLVTSGKTVRVTVYILGAGGGAAIHNMRGYYATGGGGGNQTVEVELTPGTYDIVIGSGGASSFVSLWNDQASAGTGGNTCAFGYTCTGGSGGEAGATHAVGIGGTPNGGNGNTGSYNTSVAGGSPNGGNIANNTANTGGNGLVRITFS